MPQSYLLERPQLEQLLRHAARCVVWRLHRSAVPDLRDFISDCCLVGLGDGCIDGSWSVFLLVGLVFGLVRLSLVCDRFCSFGPASLLVSAQAVDLALAASALRRLHGVDRLSAARALGKLGSQLVDVVFDRCCRFGQSLFVYLALESLLDLSSSSMCDGSLSQGIGSPDCSSVKNSLGSWRRSCGGASSFVCFDACLACLRDLLVAIRALLRPPPQLFVGVRLDACSFLHAGP